jgi:hypothetical protein
LNQQKILHILKKVTKIMLKLYLLETTVQSVQCDLTCAGN